MKTIPSPDKQAGCCCASGASKPTVLNLPVAPRSLARIRFAPTDDLVRAVAPAGALAWLEENCDQGAVIEAVNVTGPGDPLAEIEPTMETLRLMQQKHPEMKIRLTTLGVHGEKYAHELTKNGVSYVTLLVDVVDAEIAKKLYAWIRPGRKTVPLAQAVDLLISEQQKAVPSFKDAGCTITISTTVYPGYNDTHIEKIAATMASLGAEAMTLVPCRPGADPQDEMPVPPDEEMMASLSNQAGKYMTILAAQERAESGIGKGCASISGRCTTQSALVPKPSKERPNVAVASLTGMEVDLHLGQAYQFLIYGPREDGLACLLETRPAPEPGGGDSRWQTLAKALDDCFALLASGAGSKPRKMLGDHGITVLIAEDDIEGTVDVLFGGKKKGKKGLN